MADSRGREATRGARRRRRGALCGRSSPLTSTADLVCLSRFSPLSADQRPRRFSLHSRLLCSSLTSVPMSTPPPPTPPPSARPLEMDRADITVGEVKPVHERQGQRSSEHSQPASEPARRRAVGPARVAF